MTAGNNDNYSILFLFQIRITLLRGVPFIQLDTLSLLRKAFTADTAIYVQSTILDI